MAIEVRLEEKIVGNVDHDEIEEKVYYTMTSECGQSRNFTPRVVYRYNPAHDDHQNEQMQVKDMQRTRRQNSGQFNSDDSHFNSEYYFEKCPGLFDLARGQNTTANQTNDRDAKKNQIPPLWRPY